MPVPPAPTLPTIIIPGQPGHIAHHEAIHEALNNDTVSLSADQSIGGSKQWTDVLFYDETGTGPGFNAPFSMKTEYNPATVLQYVDVVHSFITGDGATFIGAASIVGIVEDHADATAMNKGVGWALKAEVRPHFDRDNGPFDDFDGLVIENNGDGYATDGIYVGHNRSDKISNPDQPDWIGVFTVDAWATYLLIGNGHYQNGLDLHNATISGSAILLGNAQAIKGRNVADSGNIEIAQVTDNSSSLPDRVALADQKVLINPATGNLTVVTNNAGIVGRTTAAANVSLIKVNTTDVVAIAEGKVLVNQTTGNVSIITNNAGLYGRTAANAAVLMASIDTSDHLVLYEDRARVLAGGGLRLKPVSSVPGTPGASGFVIYNDAGTLKAIGSSGTITTLAAA